MLGPEEEERARANERARLAGLTVDTTKLKLSEKPSGLSPARMKENQDLDSQLPGDFQNTQILQQSMAELNVNIPTVGARRRNPDGTSGSPLHSGT